MSDLPFLSISKTIGFGIFSITVLMIAFVISTKYKDSPNDSLALNAIFKKGEFTSESYAAMNNTDNNFVKINAPTKVNKNQEFDLSININTNEIEKNLRAFVINLKFDKSKFSCVENKLLTNLKEKWSVLENNCSNDLGVIKISAAANNDSDGFAPGILNLFTAKLKSNTSLGEANFKVIDSSTRNSMLVMGTKDHLNKGIRLSGIYKNVWVN